MPKPAPINPSLIRAVFTYNPVTGTLHPTKTAPLVIRCTGKRQWAVGEYRYTLHRLVWAWHNPDNANPYAVQFSDHDSTNTRIENLYCVHTNPRWVGHVKQIQGRWDAQGNIRLVGAPTPPTPPTPPPNPPLHDTSRYTTIPHDTPQNA